MKRVLLTILKNRIEVKHFSILLKPKKLLPIMKILPRSQKTQVLQKKPLIPQSLKVEIPLSPGMIQKNSLNDLKNYQKALKNLYVLSYNHQIIKKQALSKLFSFNKKYKLFQKTFPIIIKNLYSLIKPKFSNVLNSIRQMNQFCLNLSCFAQNLEYVCFKNFMNAKAHSFLMIKQYIRKKRVFLDNRKVLTHFEELLASKIYKKSYFSFTLIKNYGNRKFHLIEKTKKAKKFLETFAKITQNSCEKKVWFSFFIIKNIYIQEKSFEKYFYLSKTLKKIFSHALFYKYYEIFTLIKRQTFFRLKTLQLRNTKLFFILKKRYTKLTALGFL